MKDEVIRLYLQGLSRDDIARTCGVAEGTVSNIIDDWKRKLDIPDVQSLRDLAVNLKRYGIDAAQCAKGLGVLNTMRKLGVNEDQFESFILEVYENCFQRAGLTSENIASNSQSLIKLSKDIPIAKIPEYIEEKKQAITKLDGEIKLLKENKEGLEIETSAVRGLHDAAIEDEKITVLCSQNI